MRASMVLPVPHLAADLDDALVLLDGVQQRFQEGAAPGAGEEELGVGGDAEGRLGEAEMRQVHHCPCSLARRVAALLMRAYRVVRLMPSRRAARLMLPSASRSAAWM